MEVLSHFSARAGSQCPCEPIDLIWLENFTWAWLARHVRRGERATTQREMVLVRPVQRRIAMELVLVLDE